MKLCVPVVILFYRFYFHLFGLFFMGQRRKRNRSPGLTKIADDIRDQEQVSTTSVRANILRLLWNFLSNVFVMIDFKGFTSLMLVGFYCMFFLFGNTGCA